MTSSLQSWREKKKTRILYLALEFFSKKKKTLVRLGNVPMDYKLLIKDKFLFPAMYYFHHVYNNIVFNKKKKLHKNTFFLN